MNISPRFLKRFLSALIIGPLSLALLASHPLVFEFVIAVSFLIAVWEWVGIVRAVPKRKIQIALFGALYIPVCFLAFWAIRGTDTGPVLCPDEISYGVSLVLMLMVTVWASDTGAYAFGKAIGGPKMTPTLSPNKTWAGLGGAMFSAGVMYTLAFYVRGFFSPKNDNCTDMGQLSATFTITSLEQVFFLFLFGCIIGLVCQVGDLLISVFKRRSGLKDTGNLIPGHGGLLDRIDSLMLASLFLFIILKLSAQ